MAEIVVSQIKWQNPAKLTNEQYHLVKIKLTENAPFYQRFNSWEEISTYALGTLIGSVLIAVGYFFETVEIAMIPGFFLAFIYGFILLIQLPRVILKRKRETKYYSNLAKDILDSEDYESFCARFYQKYPTNIQSILPGNPSIVIS